MARVLSIRTYIAGLIVGGIIPLLVFSSVMVIRAARNERAAVERNIRYRATDMAASLDSELLGMQAPLFVLAGAESLQSDDFATFYEQARALGLRQKWTIILADQTGREIINTRVPFGTALPVVVQHATLQQVTETGLPVISDVLTGASSGQPLVSIVLPVKRMGRPNLYLIVNVIDTVTAVATKLMPPVSAFAAVLDRQGRFIARVPSVNGVVGQPVRASTLEQLHSADEGSFRGMSRTGVPVFNTFSHVPLTGWGVVIAVPVDALYAPLRRSELAIAAGGAGTLLLALGIAALLGRHVARKVALMSGLAASLGRGEAVAAPPPTGIREVDSVGSTLAEAAATIGQRTAERETALAALRREAADRERVEQQLLRAQKMEAIGQLTGGIAHDFNNILGAVVGYLELAADRVAGDPETAETVEAALSSVMHAAELTRRLLAFARQQPLEPRVTNINDLVSSMAPLLRRTLGEANTIVVSQAADLWTAMADPARIEDALLNLTINARDAMPGGGVLTIETANVVLDERYAADNPEVTSGAYVMLAVTDTGTGMPPEIIERAFEPFFTTKEAGKGSGLGLSMVYGFAKQSAGHLKIYSEIGHGTSVKLYLPRGGAMPGVRADDAVRAPIPGGTETILVVEDNPAMRAVADRILRDLGYRVHQAENASVALEIIDRGEPVDLLFTDIVMPGGMTGRQLADEVRLRRPELPVIFTSGYAGSAISNGNGSIKVAGVIAKPYRRQELAARIRKALSGGVA